jgi:formylglycine-generating enzyme required for sulfatase activity
MLLVPGPTKTTCIDVTEVTQKQYAAWLGTSPATTGQPAGCTSNSSYLPTCGYNAVNYPNRPVVCVDWCDAHAYCKGVGKRLCGKIGGGPVEPKSNTDPAQSEWHFACTKNGALPYPYGPVPSNFACVGLDNSNFLVQQAAGSVTSCQGGYSGLYDMSGNASEWEDSCNVSNECYARGGHYLSKPAELACAAQAKFTRMSREQSRGFRCCAD